MQQYGPLQSGLDFLFTVGLSRVGRADSTARRNACPQSICRCLIPPLETLVTLDTLLAWHRKLIAKKWTYARTRPGRPRVGQEVTDWVLRMATENMSWGYDRIQGALANLGHVIAPNTVKNILKSHGTEPAPEREQRTSWKGFLKTH